MTTVLQVSDTHIVAPGQMVAGRLDTAASLQKLVTRIGDMLPQIGPVDAVLVSGDLSDDGSRESYAHFRALLAPLDLPLFVIPGNHDCRAHLREAFADDGYLPQTGRLNWHRQVGEVDLIGLDTLVEGQGGGVLEDETLEFLQDALAKVGQRPVLLALHHPPFDCGIWFMDAIGLSGSDALTDLLQASQAEIRILCGHIHSMMVMSVGRAVAISSPSPCSSFAFDLRADAPKGFLTQEDGFLVHQWQQGFRSVRIPLEGGAGPFQF
ncbi:metallophosphoesterase [uncultured Roseovarius sp.]|uniref:metallophosphoesterase n=1 Tax=uncultured Roseovarius sp. TaxID=293344 RepID=UPI0026089060|nr:metallophosphoesterase [uncultured Roseovarius sp.]